jgi:WD40 repeat protein
LDVLTGVQKPLPRLAEETTRLGGVTTSPDGRLVALAHENSHVHVFDRAAGREVARIETGPDSSDVVAFSADGFQLAISEAGGAIQLWDVRTWQKARRIVAHADAIYAISFSAGGELVSSSIDGSFHVENLATGGNWKIYDDEGDPTSLAIAPDDRTLAIGTFDGALKLWNMSSRQQVIALEAGSSIVRTVAFSADGTALASATYDGKVRVWRAPEWTEIRATEGKNRF